MQTESACRRQVGAARAPGRRHAGGAGRAPLPVFELDRYTFLKELVLLAAALAAALLCLASARRLTLFMVDALVWPFWCLGRSPRCSRQRLARLPLAGRILAGAALFWARAALARAGRGEAVLAGSPRRSCSGRSPA